MRNRRWISLVLVPLLVLVACGDDDDGSPTVASDDATTTTAAASGPEVGGGVIELTIADNGSAIEVPVGAVIEVQLETCPSCGYSWAQMGDAGTGGLSVVSEEDGPSDNAEGETGGTVMHVVRLEATSPGESSITYGYFPPADDAPDEVFSVDVTIIGDGEASGAVGESPFGTADVTVTAAEADTEIELAVGQTLDVVLDVPDAEDGSWEEMAGNDSGALEHDGQEDVVDGDRAQTWFRFTAASSGHDGINLSVGGNSEDGPVAIVRYAVHIASEDGDDGVRELTAADDGSTLDAELGLSFDVVLEECRGCGYTWQITSSTGEVVYLVADTYRGGPEEVEGEEPMAGGSHERVFHFVVGQPGAEVIEIGSVPPGAEEPEETFSVTVTGE